MGSCLISAASAAQFCADLSKSFGPFFAHRLTFSNARSDLSALVQPCGLSYSLV